MGRLRQIRDVIFERMGAERKESLKDQERNVRTLAEFIAGGPGEKNFSAAKQIRFVKKDEDDLPSTEQVTRMFGG